MSGVLDAAARLASPWAYIILGLLAAAESAAFVGLAIPGEAAMLLGGFLAHQGRVNLPVMIVAGAVGAVVGDQLGYEIGHLFGEPLKRSRLGRRVGQDRWARGEAYLRAKGGRAVFLGRFVGVLRALVPALAGMSRMPYRTFLPWNVAGGVIWAPGLVLAGYLAGRSYQRVEQLAGQASLLLAAVLVLVGGVGLGARWVARHPDRVRALADRQLDRPWVARVRARYQRQLGFLAERLRPGGALGLTLTASVVALVGAGWAFGAVLLDVLAGLAWWARTRGWRPLGLLAAASLGAWILSNTIKTLTHRARPPVTQAIGHWTGYAFPSGHTTRVTAIYGMLAALLAVTTPRWGRKVALWTAAMLVAGLVGLSRLYLGASWLTDVLGGLALGAAWLFVLLTATRILGGLHDDTTATHPPPAGRQPAEATPLPAPLNDHRPARRKQQGS